jgi:hypothetical protein
MLAEQRTKEHAEFVGVRGRPSSRANVRAARFPEQSDGQPGVADVEDENHVASS